MTPLNKQAYQHLQKLIIQGEFEYNKIYSETKLSRELGISRTPFRDAVHRLAQEGYIDIIPSKGFMLHQLTRQDIDETFQVRSALECYCTLAITKAHKNRSVKKLLKELRMLTDILKEIMDSGGSIEEFCEYDFQYHTKIIDYSENRQFVSIFATFKYRMRKLAELSLAHEGRMQDTYEEHLAIVEAMENNDTEHIYEITLAHMNTARKINLDDL
ncbi:GntR family transcriptional regulator [Lachnospiraceae bacterium 56-18]